MDATCTDCGAPATCRYDWGAGMRYGCAAHDPLRPVIAATVRVPGFYQSLPHFPILATTGHLGIARNCLCANGGVLTAICPVHPPMRPVVIC